MKVHVLEDGQFDPAQRMRFEDNLPKGVCFQNRSLWPPAPVVHPEGAVDAR